MYTSCINHPSDEPYINIHPWQIAACDGDHCAAMLLGYFEGWHNWSLRKAEKNGQLNRIAAGHGEPENHDITLLQWHTEAQLIQGLLGFFSKNIIARGLDILQKKGFITREKNPRPKYQFDRTRYFLFHPKAVNAWLKTYPSAQSSEVGDPSPISGASSPKSDSRSSKNGASSSKSGGYIENKYTHENNHELEYKRERGAPSAPRAADPPDKRAREIKAGIIDICGLSEPDLSPEDLEILARAVQRCIDLNLSPDDLQVFKIYWIRIHEKKPRALLLQYLISDIGGWAQTVKPSAPRQSKTAPRSSSIVSKWVQDCS